MFYVPGRNGRKIGRTLAAAVSVLVAAVGLVTFSGAAPAMALTGVRLPLLLVHGWSDSCHDAFDQTSMSYAASYDVTTVSYLTSHAFSDVRNVGYYTGNWKAIYDNGASVPTSDAVGTGNCNVNVQTGASTEAANACGGAGSHGTYTADPIEHLACLFAWYVYEVNIGRDGNAGTAVDVLAHSMGGLIVRAAEYYTSASRFHGGYTFPPAGLRIRRVVTVATPHGGLQAGVAYLYNQPAYADQEITDMTVCPNYGATCTLTASALGLTIGQTVNLATSPLMLDLRNGGTPRGAYGTYWALMGSSVECNPIDGRTWLTCLVGRKAVGLDPYSGTDFVVYADSTMAMPADYKIMYGDVEHWTGGPVPTVYHSGGDSYTHEANTCGNVFGNGTVCASAPFYLNDSRGGTEGAFICQSACNGGITDVNFTGTPSSAPYSLAEIVALLPVPPPLPTSSLVLRSAGTGNGLYVSAELGYTGSSYGMLRARASSLGSWESWTEVYLTSGYIALINNANGLYVSAELGYTGSDYGELRARASTVGPWEQFRMIFNSDGTYSLRSVANGLYVSAELGYTGANYGELRARASSIGSWEKYTTNTGPFGCTNYGSSTITGPNSCTPTFSTHSVWYSGGGVGLYGQEIWTYANGTTQDSTATYQLSGLDTTYVMQLQAYIPNNYSDASHAHYHYCSPGGGCADGYVNQNNYTNQWAVFGAVCTTDGTATITLADDGGDVYPAIVGADAIRAVRVGGIIC